MVRRIDGKEIALCLKKTMSNLSFGCTVEAEYSELFELSMRLALVEIDHSLMLK